MVKENISGKQGEKAIVNLGEKASLKWKDGHGYTLDIKTKDRISIEVSKEQAAEILNQGGGWDKVYNEENHVGGH